MADNMQIWDAVKTPPKTALKEIKGGRLSGMTDISPQWRLQALTEQFGPAGIGWTYEITRQWTELGPEGQVAAFVDINLYIHREGEWSRAIPGTGGSMLVAKEKGGLHFSDEAFKMATTDAISVAAKTLGFGSDVYMGQLDSKYQRQATASDKNPSPARTAVNERIKSALKTLFGDDKKAALDAVEKETSFYSKRDQKQVPGKRDYTSLSDKQAEILVEKLEVEAAKKRAEPRDNVPDVCAGCGATLSVDGCPSCDDIPF